MTVENTTNIAGLDDTLPLGSDMKSEGDNHLRLIKTVLKHGFAGFPGEVLLAATEAQGMTVNDYVLTVAPAPTAYAANTAVVFRATHANTGAATLKVGALAAKALVNPEGTPLRANAITATTWVLAVYDGTNFRIIGGGNSQAIYDYANQLAFQTVLPDQAGNAGKVLRTDGATAAWGLAVPAQTGMAGKYLRTDGTSESWQSALPNYAPGSEPTSDQGDIWINGIGPCRWHVADGRYYSIPGTRGITLRFTTSQTWTPDAYTKSAKSAIVQGGGAGGGYGGSGASIAGGGGAGGAPGVTIDRADVALTPGVGMPVVVGSGGAGATATTPNPSGGGTSSFAGLSAAGGVSSGGNGDLVWGGVPRGPGSSPGGNGAASASGPAGSGGAGGGTIFGHGGTAGSRSGTAGEAGLQGGSAPVANSGAGGGGAGGSLATTAFRFGGDGAAGCVIVEL